MCLEALMVLLNPDVALDCNAPLEVRLREDIPPLADCTQVCWGGGACVYVRLCVCEFDCICAPLEVRLREDIPPLADCTQVS